MHWACLLLPQLALDAALRQQADPAVPLVLLSGPAQRRVLHAVSPAARQLGVRRGMLLSAAQVLTRNLRVVDYDPRAEQATRQLLASWLYGFSSQVSMAFPHALALEIGASRALFGDWPSIETRLQEGLQALGFRYRVVAAPNPHAAWVLTHVHARLGVAAEQLDATLAQVPVERSGLAADAVTVLARSGLRTLGAAFQLPRDSLARRFSPAVLAHLDALRGIHTPPLRYYQPPDRFEARIEFDYEIESTQAMLFPLRRLTGDLAAFLCSRDGGVQRFELWFEHDQHPDTCLAIGLLAPERDAAMLFELARNRMDHLQLPAGSRGLRLQAEHLPPFVPAARDLFDPRPQQAMPWEQVRERLRARLGDDAVQGLGLRGDHRPERASGDAAGAPKGSPPPLPRRPGWLLPRPEPLLDPRLRILSGPERIESGWWDEGDIRRDYYVVETAQGQRGWAYASADTRGAPWMLHGWFG